MDDTPKRFPPVSAELADLLAGGTDADLLHIIGTERERNREWADAALCEIHRRHVRFLYGVCARICNNYLSNPNFVDDLLYDTMWTIFRTAEKFDPGKTKCNGEPKCLQRAVRSWMSRKAWWLAKGVVGGSSGQVPISGYDQEPVDPWRLEDDEQPEFREEVAGLINRLPSRERHIIICWFCGHDYEAGKPVPPDEHVDVYCARRWGITPEYVRKIRSRTLISLRESLAPQGLHQVKHVGKTHEL